MESLAHDDGPDRPGLISPRLDAVLARLDDDPAFAEQLFDDPGAIVAAHGLDAADVDALAAFLRDQGATAGDASGRRQAGAALFSLLAKLHHPGAPQPGEWGYEASTGR
jgi:hypothetical protein